MKHQTTSFFDLLTFILIGPLLMLLLLTTGLAGYIATAKLVYRLSGSNNNQIVTATTYRRVILPPVAVTGNLDLAAENGDNLPVSLPLTNTAVAATPVITLESQSTAETSPSSTPPATQAAVPSTGLQPAPEITTATGTLPPTSTPTKTPSPTRTPTATATDTRPPTHTSTATSTRTPSPTPVREGWVFSSVRTDPDEEGDNLLLYGELLNDTGQTQKLNSIRGTFYDARGTVIATKGGSHDVPIPIIPQGGQVPFKLTVTDIKNAADFDL